MADNNTTSQDPTQNGTEQMSNKRKRTSLSAEPTKAQVQAGIEKADTDAARRDAVAKVSADMLAVLSGLDTAGFNILEHPLNSIATADPPAKRAKSGEDLPNTIGGRLRDTAYASLAALVGDVKAVCRAVIEANPGAPRERLARVKEFEMTVRELVDTERRRRAGALDLVAELMEEGEERAEKTALAVLTNSIPLFTSLQKPVRTQHGEVVIDSHIPPAVLPREVSTVKATPAVGQNLQNVPTLVEAFPPMPVRYVLEPAKAERMQFGVKWGGELGYGGIPPHTATELKTEAAPHWLQYTNAPAPGASRLGVDPYRQGIGLPRDFVAAFSSFAPTRDEGVSKVPRELAGGIWWEKKGRRVFNRMFSSDPAIGHLFQPPAPPTKTLVVGQPQQDAVKELLSIPEAELEAAISNFDPALLTPTTPDEILSEISTLLATLQSEQYARFATPLPPHTPLPPPSQKELDTYNTLKDRLHALISSLPPHLVATIDGSPDADLLVSKRLPLRDPPPPVRGSLPVDDRKLPQTPMAASAMDAAAGVASPIRPPAYAPVNGMPMPPMQPMGTPMPPVPVPGAPMPMGTPYRYPVPPQMQPMQVPQMAMPVPPQQQPAMSPRRQQPGMMVHGLAPAVGVGGYRAPPRR